MCAGAPQPLLETFVRSFIPRRRLRFVHLARTENHHFPSQLHHLPPAHTHTLTYAVNTEARAAISVRCSALRTQMTMQKDLRLLDDRPTGVREMRERLTLSITSCRSVRCACQIVVKVEVGRWRSENTLCFVGGDSINLLPREESVSLLPSLLGSESLKGKRSII